MNKQDRDAIQNYVGINFGYSNDVDYENLDNFLNSLEDEPCQACINLTKELIVRGKRIDELQALTVEDENQIALRKFEEYLGETEYTGTTTTVEYYKNWLGKEEK